MSRALDITKLKDKYVNETFGYLTVLDVFRENSILYFKCQCKCGVIKNISKKHILSGSVKSCGCYNRSHEKGAIVSEWYKNNPDKVKERNLKVSHWYKDNPDKVKERSEKYSKWCKDNPEKVKEICEKRLLFYKEHPEVLQILSEKNAQWRENNKDKLASIGKQHSQWFKDNPDKVKERDLKISQWYKDNPDKVKERSRKYSKWCKKHVSEVKTRLSVSRYKRIEKLKNTRLQTDFSILFDYLDDDQINKLLLGELMSTDKIRSKCPICGEYDYHTLRNIFTISTSKLRLGNMPLCRKCRVSLSSSRYESEIADFISTLYTGELVRNSRDIIFPLELDLYYPEKHIAIEFNGDYWHSELYKDKDYHYSKFKSCLENDIVLVSIFESYWLNDKITIKEYLRDLFNGLDNSISFKDNYMDNNYPSPNYYKLTDSYVESSYTVGKNTVYTCGYSLMNNIEGMKVVKDTDMET
jgi:hypothetical protein